MPGLPPRMEAPETVKVFEPKVRVPVPAVRVKPLTVVKVGVVDKVIWVEVPIKTFCPPLMFKFVPYTLGKALVACPRLPGFAGLGTMSVGHAAGGTLQATSTSSAA